MVPKIVFAGDAQAPDEPGVYVLTGRWDFSGKQPVFEVDIVEAEKPGQRQDSLAQQLKDLAVIAERQHGMYDAADWIRRFLSKTSLVWPVNTRVHHVFADPAKQGLIVGYDSDGGVGGESFYLVRWDGTADGIGRVLPARLRLVEHEHRWSEWSYESNPAGVRFCETCPAVEHD